MDERIESIQGTVAEFSKWHERGMGAVILINFVAASVGGLPVTFGKKSWVVILGFLPCYRQGLLTVRRSHLQNRGSVTCPDHLGTITPAQLWLGGIFRFPA